MEQPLAVNAENSRAKVQNVGGDSSASCQGSGVDSVDSFSREGGGQFPVTPLYVQ
jgi:hypothetical protein